MGKKELLFLTYYIQRIVTSETGSIPVSSHLTLKDKELLQFLNNMNDSERMNFVEAIFHFDLYMKVINPCRNLEDTGGVWTNFVLVCLFGLIEKIMEEYKSCYNYIGEYIKRCINPKATKDVLNEWREKYGANKKVHRFFELYILDSEKTEIINTLKKNPNFNFITQSEDPIEKFINWIIKCRSGFVHALSLEGLSAFNIQAYINPDESEDLTSANMIWYPTVGIDELIHYVLLGVFRRYDSKKVLSTIR
jgi:hypothetical protein